MYEGFQDKAVGHKAILPTFPAATCISLHSSAPALLVKLGLPYIFEDKQQWGQSAKAEAGGQTASMRRDMLHTHDQITHPQKLPENAPVGLSQLEGQAGGLV